MNNVNFNGTLGSSVKNSNIKSLAAGYEPVCEFVLPNFVTDDDKMIK